VNMQRENRKLEHIRQALQTESGPLSAGWEEIRIVHQALLKGNWDEVDLSVSLFHKKLALPIYINAMTGGALGLEEINRMLAETAREYGLGMAVGSQTSALQNDQRELVASYKIAREVNPDGFLMANVGAGVKPEMALAAVEMIEADALQLHLNGVQELTMAEGDRSFHGLAENIEKICRLVPVPVIVKEVGNGLSKEVAGQLAQLGVQGVDTGGSGGTNFAAIELNRFPRAHLDGLRFWGIPSAISLLEVLEALEGGAPKLHVFASGGVTCAQQVLKALVLGAVAVGIAGCFLHILQQDGPAALRKAIAKMTEELKIMMLLCSVSNINQLKKVPVVITGLTGEWCVQRGINTQKYAQRGIAF
jgi:isopentenyl-diphosphate delta-isomerase